ncbi:hypothetical protein DICPUDRAFT_98751 [Dictyostelium purpureum]|uniref:PA14 domain-containing protein n=1 Tax=Dictyostelium purpureum TaxID=5786 RepID=F0ZT82_DICPU|nr:uncharacterized protein DICPUDRAFT_98751 [Dictyostelium purpureum]EGC32839.1 hypothetical protein DICPUDRAFT_98751 [Dictyostelium purpureum]|eukprot:XP_003290624.1 hypothetical protein DICPUDRAFT_98751 [Dictyostelium purpureum]
MLFYKIIVFSIICSYIYETNGQDKLRPDKLNFYVRNFKNSRNSDFDMLLSDEYSSGIMDSVLPDDKRPKYCCGENPKYDDYGTLLVHNEDTFNEWFNSDGTCNNYLEVVSFPYDNWDDEEFFVSTDDIFYPFEGKGFGNVTEFPEYENDPYNQFYCLEAHFTAIPDQPYSTFHFLSGGEVWVYVGGKLVIDQAGTNEVGFYASTMFGAIEGMEYFKEYDIDIYTCARSSVIIPELPFYIGTYSLNVFCRWIDDNGVCNGGYFKTVCPDDPISCTENIRECGVCSSINRTCDDIPITTCTYPVCVEGSGCIIQNIDCDDLDPCTVDTCDETIGCVHTNIPNCRCNTTNCITIDQCFPKICLDDDTCAETLRDCSLELPNCQTPLCSNGDCICDDDHPVNPPTSTTGQPTSTTTTTSPGTTGVSTTTGVSSTTSTIGSTKPPILTNCDNFSCPNGYVCIQLSRSYTCVSEHFNHRCDVDNLNIYF